MFKKVICSIIVLQLIIFNYMVVIGDDVDDEYTQEEVIDVANEVTSEEPKLNSRMAVAYDRNSGTVIWGKNENKKTAMASTTKIMTAIIAIENSDLSEMITVSQKAAGTGGSRLGLKKEDKITMRDLLYGLMLVSGNDAAVAIAENVGGSVEGFAELMNAKAKELNLSNTHFVTPHGLDNPEHYTTAIELAKIADYALKNETFSKIVSTKNYTITKNGYPKNLTNTNELLGYLNGVTGVKTGFTNNAGRCLVTSINRNGFEIITVVLGADTKKNRTADSINLIEYVYANYEPVNIKNIVEENFNDWCLINKNRIYVNKCKNRNVELYISNLEHDVIPINKSNKDNVVLQISSLFYLEAPVEKDDVIGTAKVLIGDEVVDVLDIRAKRRVEKNNVADYFSMFATCVFE